MCPLCTHQCYRLQVIIYNHSFIAAPKNAHVQTPSSGNPQERQDLSICIKLGAKVGESIIKSINFYKCDHDNCGKVFDNSSNLKDHQRRHNKDRPYSCDQCNKSYFRRYQLTAHLKKYHPSQAIEDF
ncbi:hypothetical protein FGO68_gene14335 [Halteria grandinella]|uniref:C2H2-type domain-containing protein n=1 Tax=Halteria grandinella TaxID=5974 RepID=A0A8J8T6I7_HALGN|nr:hypothetical protein FGO68_gene14335 [Halteria grandinella]